MTYLRISLELLQETRRATPLVVAHAARRYVRSTWNIPPLYTPCRRADVPRTPFGLCWRLLGRSQSLFKLQLGAS